MFLLGLILGLAVGAVAGAIAAAVWLDRVLHRSGVVMTMAGESVRVPELWKAKPKIQRIK
jgi:hypothetical protein